MLDAAGQPTPRAHAYTVRAVLAAQLARLKEIPLDLMYHGDSAEQTRADAIAIAIEHLKSAIDALELASRE
jgi:hypothetical protein